MELWSRLMRFLGRPAPDGELAEVDERLSQVQQRLSEIEARRRRLILEARLRRR